VSCHIPVVQGRLSNLGLWIPPQQPSRHVVFASYTGEHRRGSIGSFGLFSTARSLTHPNLPISTRVHIWIGGGELINISTDREYLCMGATYHNLWCYFFRQDFCWFERKKLVVVGQGRNNEFPLDRLTLALGVFNLLSVVSALWGSLSYLLAQQYVAYWRVMRGSAHDPCLWPPPFGTIVYILFAAAE